MRRGIAYLLALVEELECGPHSWPLQLAAVLVPRLVHCPRPVAVTFAPLEEVGERAMRRSRREGA